MSKPEALLFDFGNVLVHIDFERVFAHWARAAGASVQQVSSRFTFDEPFKAHEDARLEAAAYWARLRSTLGIDLTDAQFLEGWNAVFIDEVGGIGELLAELAQEYPLYLFSNTNGAHFDAARARFPHLLRHFRSLYLSHELGMRKPSAEAFRHVAALMGCQPEAIAFFDDLAENVDGAKSVGMQAHQVASVAEIHRALGRA